MLNVNQVLEFSNEIELKYFAKKLFPKGSSSND